jgi:4'-phosphopantetheinyl transferase
VTVVLAAAAADQRRQAAELLRAAAARAVRANTAAVRVLRSPGGGPLLGGAAAGLHASVSHGRGITAVAIAELGPVGVDVEPIRPLPAVALARRWFAPAEAAWLHAQPPAHAAAAFLRLWTVKEAIGKALGTGLAGGLLSRDLGLPRRQAAADRLAVLPGSDGVAVATPPVPAGVGRPTLGHPGIVLAVACAAAGAGGAEVSIVAVAADGAPAGPRGG